MERKNDNYVVISDDEAPPKRRHLNTASAKKPLRGLTAVARDGSSTKSRFKIPDGPNANPLDIFPFAEDFKKPPAFNSIMDGITHPNNTFNKTSAKENKFKSCLTKVRELFPDICQEHVRKLYNDRMKGFTTFRKAEDDFSELDLSPLIIEQLLDEDAYPKEKEMGKKRKRDANSCEEANAPVLPKFEALKTPSYVGSARKILESEFTKVPSNYVRLLLLRGNPLYEVYSTLEASERSYPITGNPAYRRMKKERKTINDSELFILLPSAGPEREQLRDELSFAREKCRKENDARLREKEFAEKEAQNEKKQAEIGAMVECQCCYVDVPLNRTIHCENNDGHFFCYDCIKNSAKSQIGLMRYEMKCFDTSGCQSAFSKGQLRKALDEALMSKLDTIQQRHEIEAAGIDGLNECPFCDFRAICPPVEEDREFRCYNPECEKVSCRLCNKPSHIPKTCDEAKKEDTLSTRHHIEEAMSEALMRICPKCRVKIIKEDGCNKMQCTKCRTLMCYVCKKDITKEGYNHFDQGRFGPPEPGKCAVYDRAGLNRHQEEVERAQKEAFQKAKVENPGLSEIDVGVKSRAHKKRSHAAGRVAGDLEGAQDLLLLAQQQYHPGQPYPPFPRGYGGGHQAAGFPPNEPLPVALARARREEFLDEWEPRANGRPAFDGLGRALPPNPPPLPLLEPDPHPPLFRGPLGGRGQPGPGWVNQMFHPAGPPPALLERGMPWPAMMLPPANNGTFQPPERPRRGGPYNPGEIYRLPYPEELTGAQI